MLMYLVKHSRIDLANPSRELSRSMDRATVLEFKEMLRIILHTLKNKNLGLRMKPVEFVGNFLSMVGLSDSDWAGDKVTRKSVTGFVIYLLGVPVA